MITNTLIVLIPKQSLPPNVDQSYTWGMGVETWMRIVGKGIYIRQGTQGYIIDIFNF